MLVATAVLAVVAIAAAVIAVRAARRVAVAAVRTAVAPTARPASLVLVENVEPSPAAPPEARVVEDRLVVPPTQQQVVSAALGRPQARLTIAAHGLAHALRPESRDRILALMRREYRRRRRLRLKAARRAVREATPQAEPADSWIGELPSSKAVGE